MTVKIHRKPRRMRNSVMESLGFTETPSVSYTSAPAPQARPTRLISTTGTQGGTVKEIWDTTELDADSMVDWQPIEVDRKRLNKKVRWPLFLAWVFILGILGFGAYWMWENSTNTAQTATETVTASARSLDAALQPLAEAVDSLAPGEGPVNEGFTVSVTAAADASRDLFSAVADLAPTEVALRTNATDAATQALDATRTATNLAAYLASVSSLMATPEFVTDPGLIDLATAATDFGDWRGRFESVRSSLPEGVLAGVTDELRVIAGSFDAIQSSYLDGLRENDPDAAALALANLTESLDEVWQLLLDETETAKAGILERIGKADELLGFLA